MGHTAAELAAVTRAQLVAILVALHQTTNGNKQVLVERILARKLKMTVIN